MPSLHTVEEIAAFLKGEKRFIAAAYRDPARAGELFVLENGQADAIRRWTPENLQCFVPGCVSPEIRVVSRARGGRRDGFSHRVAASHPGESFHHIQGKAVLAHWLRKQPAVAAVQIEAASDTQRSRVADVMATLIDGSRVAFEVQYAALTVDAWQARHDSYAEQGIQDVWMWGHTRLRRPRSPYEPGFWLDDLQDAVRRAGMPVLWLNPGLAEVAIAVTETSYGEALAQSRDIDVRLAPLESFTVDRNGITESA